MTLTVSATVSDAVAWYCREYPDGPDHDPRCLDTLAAWQRLYNIHPVGIQAKDGGFRQVGAGVVVKVRGAYLSTFDGAELTRLVVAAHRNACRVQVSAARDGALVIQVNPRSHDGDHLYNHHPDLNYLVDCCTREGDR